VRDRVRAPARGALIATTPQSRSSAELVEANRRFYDALWTDARLIPPDRFNTWPLAHSLAAAAPRRLEVAPGLRPRLPLAGTEFADVSAPALAKLRACGASAVFGMQPRSSLLLGLATWYLTHRREKAMWYYNRVFMPLGARFQTSLPRRRNQGSGQ